MKKNSLLLSRFRNAIVRLTLTGRIIFVFFTAVFTVGIFGGIVTISQSFSEEVPQFGGTYHEGIVGVPRFINPVLANSDADHDLTSLIFSGLVRKDENGNLIPDLAESWDINQEGTLYTFHLKPGLTFHDGSSFGPEDIIFTVSKIQDPAIKSPLRAAWSGIAVTAIDDTTIQFTLEKPYAGFMQQLTLGILPESIWGTVPVDEWQTSAYNSEAIGTGPYKVHSITRSKSGLPSYFSLVAFKQFTLGKPLIKKVTVKTFANKQEAYTAINNQSIDGLSMIDASDIAKISSQTYSIITEPLPRVFSVFLNPARSKLFTDQNVVRALNLAIDRTALINTVFQGYGTPLAGPLPQTTSSDADDHQTKLTLAESILDKAGWKINESTGIREKTTSSSTGTGKNKSTTSSKQILSFTLATANTPELEASANLIKQQLSIIGVEVVVKVFEIGTLNENSIRGRDFEALLFGQVIKHDTDVFAFWHSSQKTTPGLNITGYTNKQVDALLESALKETDYKKRFATYQKVSDQLAKDAPVIFLYTPDAIALMSNRVHNPVMPPITTASDRFSLIYKWYIHTDYVWNIFTK